ncbi:hypothetical protein [Pseudactinotalea sp.]|uniref:hypothetical protein n=1 Tax=Pseudactinotalea sp. TaxID=1926260 RepID=UPI003B3B7CAB
MTTSRGPLNRPAILTAALGIGCLVAGALWPWFGSPVGPLGTLPTPWLLWSTVAAALAVALTILGAAHTRWPLILAAVVVLASIATRVSADPGWMCWDGVDDAGNMVGGCEDDRWTPAPIVFAVGAALTVVAAVLTRLGSRPRQPVSAAP